MSDLKSDVEFLKSVAKYDEHGNASVPLKGYEQFMSERGITKEIRKQHAAAVIGMHNAQIEMCGQQLSAAIDKAVAEGRNPADEKTTVSIRTDLGPDTMTMRAARTYKIPDTIGGSTGKESVTKYGIIRHEISTHISYDKDLVTENEEMLKRKLEKL